MKIEYAVDALVAAESATEQLEVIIEAGKNQTVSQLTKLEETVRHLHEYVQNVAWKAQRDQNDQDFIRDYLRNHFQSPDGADLVFNRETLSIELVEFGRKNNGSM